LPLSSTSSGIGSRDGHLLDERRDEAVVDDDDAIDVLVRIHLRELVRDRLRVVVRRLVDESLPPPGDLVAPEAERRRALPPDDRPDDLVPRLALLPLELERAPQHLPVERPGEAAVAAEDDDPDLPLLAPLHERQVAKRRRLARGADHELLHTVCVGPHLLDAVLRAPQARARDELERLRDLARVADGGDPPPDVLEARH